MDHSWGRNVLKYGLAGTGASLAARYLPVTWATHVLTNQIDRPGILWLWVLPNTADGTYFGFEFHDPGYPHFPSHYDVEPDVPV